MARQVPELGAGFPVVTQVDSQAGKRNQQHRGRCNAVHVLLRVLNIGLRTCVDALQGLLDVVKVQTGSQHQPPFSDRLDASPV